MELTLHRDVVGDIRSLPGTEAQRAAINAVADVRTGRRVGVPLDFHAATGDLRDCRKLYFDVPGTGDRPRFRLVYRVIDEGSVEVLAAEVVAIGVRANLDAYVVSATRLGRTLP
ncbi:hypothetical protein [Cellulomonas sp. P5_C5]